MAACGWPWSALVSRNVTRSEKVEVGRTGGPGQQKPSAATQRLRRAFAISYARSSAFESLRNTPVVPVWVSIYLHPRSVLLEHQWEPGAVRH